MTALQMSEADLQRAVIDYAKLRGWLVHHDRGDYRQCIAGDPGFPDLALARDGTVLLVELKAETGKLTRPQAAWMLASQGRLFRPHHWRDGTIVEALA